MLEAIDIPVAELPADHQASDDLVARLAEMTLRRRPLAFELGFGAACFAAALYLRFAVDESLPPGFPFLTFFPAVLLAAVFASVRAGVVVAVFSGLSAWYFFVAPAYSLTLNPASATAMAFFTLIIGTELFLISAMKMALRRLRRSEKRSADLANSRALMFSELQHRVSNNLSVVAALLRLQATQSKDPEAKQVLSEAQIRINTIARLQRRLHSPNIQSVAVADFIHDMAEDTIRVAGAGAGLRLQFDLQPVQLPHEKAIPLGLIVSELLMNAVEHSVGPDSKAGTILISLENTLIDGVPTVTLDVQDSGSGLAEDFDISQSRSLGLNIARQFATQLAGELSLSNAETGGTLARLRFRM